MAAVFGGLFCGGFIAFLSEDSKSCQYGRHADKNKSGNQLSERTVHALSFAILSRRYVSVNTPDQHTGSDKTGDPKRKSDNE